MSVGAVAERYAQALFELGEESGQLSTIAEKVRSFVEVFESSRELRAVLHNPTVKKEERRSLLSAIARRLSVPDVAEKCLLIMADRRRLSALSAMTQRLTEMVDLKEGVLRASVTTAAMMPESYYQSLTSKLAAATKKKIVLTREVDEELVGGAIARIGDTLIDGSIRGKLQKMERSLLAAVTAGAS
jgi:F-type H+-transporting ATPase subunit delta